jgi:hypothetical protein
MIEEIIKPVSKKTALLRKNTKKKKGEEEEDETPLIPVKKQEVN